MQALSSLQDEHSILVVDDEPDNLEYFDRVLRSFGRVLPAKSGNEALDLARREQVSVAITDQRMPGMSGTEMLCRMQEFLPNVPKVVVTAYSDIEPVLMAVNTSSLFGYLLKPVQPSEIRLLVSRALQEFGATTDLLQSVARLKDENEELKQGNELLQAASERLSTTREELTTTIDALKLAYERMSEIAYRDELTHLQNRRRFNEVLEAEYSRARRYGGLVSLLVMDVNDFKRINDTYGHPVGDDVIQTVARTLSDSLRGSDLVFRVGGDEFSAVLPEADEEAAKKVEEKLSQPISIPLRNAEEKVTLSVGSSTLNFNPAASASNPEDSDDWYAQADVELYKKKDARRIAP